jgi:flagellar assembly protein FliH
MGRIIRGNQVDPKLLKESAFIEGRAVGFEEGKSAAAELLLEAQRSLDAQKKQMASLASEIALMLAAQVVGEAAQRSDVASLITERALRAAGNDTATIFVHPQHHESISSRFGGAYKIVADQSLQPGDCIIETSWGRLDARLSTQLAKYAEALQETIRNA